MSCLCLISTNSLPTRPRACPVLKPTMAGAKKKKKPAANPARGFATTSIASKPRADPSDANDGTSAEQPSSALPSKGGNPAASAKGAHANAAPNPAGAAAGLVADGATKKTELSPEEFERQLEESELQLLVEKHAQKVRRDAQRQRARLETDRRLLRGQAEPINARKWLPPELMDQILDLIAAEGRFATAGLGAEHYSSSGKMPPEEDLIIRLWTLEMTLAGAGFPEERAKAVLQHVLDIAPNVAAANKETIWGLDEALDWLARECSRDDLPDYDKRGNTGPKSQAGMMRFIVVASEIRAHGRADISGCTQIHPPTPPCHQEQPRRSSWMPSGVNKKEVAI